MSKCPHCDKELPPITPDELSEIMDQLKQNKEFMFNLGQEAARAYLEAVK